MRHGHRAGTFPRVWRNPVSRLRQPRCATCRRNPDLRSRQPNFARSVSTPTCATRTSPCLCGSRPVCPRPMGSPAPRPSPCRTAQYYPNSTASVCSTGMKRWARSARTLRACCGGGSPMSPEDFTMLFGALQRSAETARSAFYAFVIVYAAMLFYAMNTYVYPISQHLLSAVQEQIGSARDCDPGHVDPLCLKAAPPLDRLNAEYAAHFVEYFQDRATDERVFHVPLIGLSSDRNWFWLINVAGSFLLYTLIRGAVQKYHRLAQYLFSENK